MSIALPEEQFGQILALLGENSKGILELKSFMVEMRALRSDINTWKPQVDSGVNELEHAVTDLGERVKQALGVLLPQAVPVESGEGGVTTAQPSPTEVCGDPSGQLTTVREISTGVPSLGWCIPPSRNRPWSQVRRTP
jgi:hypothetical protein